uniref:Uncharacterized protein n=1 Tax=Arundo donax TaxID=35708 RepID=A0A0A9EIH1_ARUDO
MVPTVHTSALRHNSVVSRSTLRNSESLSMEGLHSVTPSMAPKALRSLPTGVAPENSSYPDAKGSDAATSDVSPVSQSPSMLRQLCARSMAPHLRVTSMVPHLRVSSTGKVSQVHVQSVMLQAQNSGAKTMIPVGATPPLLSGPPKGHATPTSNEELKHHQTPGMRAKGIDCAARSVALKSPDSTAISTIEGQKDSTLKNVMSSNSASQCVANKKIPIQGVVASGTVTLAADALLALSGPYEKGIQLIIPGIYVPSESL